MVSGCLSVYSLLFIILIHIMEHLTVIHSSGVTVCVLYGGLFPFWWVISLIWPATKQNFQILNTIHDIQSSLSPAKEENRLFEMVVMAV